MICFDVHTHIIRVDNRSIFNLILKEDSLAIPEAFFSSGIHPWYITDNWRMILEDHFQKDYKQRVAIGETGIDMLKGANIKLQEMVFMAHIEWALNLKMPLVIHSVRSSQRIIEILRDMKFQFPVVIHGFRQGMEVAKKISIRRLLPVAGSLCRSCMAEVDRSNKIYSFRQNIDRK
jgi:TatD DNase family protein